MSYLEVGTQAPNFTLPNQDGQNISLSDFLGKKVVLYFYPKDSTPGCTREAQDFNALKEAFEQLNAVVVGVSADSVKSHSNFACKQNLNFNLLSDETHAVLEPYGIWQLKKNYGKEYMGIVRSTYVLDENGKVLKTWKVAKADGHAQKVLEFLSK